MGGGGGLNPPSHEPCISFIIYTMPLQHCNIFNTPISSEVSKENGNLIQVKQRVQFRSYELKVGARTINTAARQISNAGHRH